MTNTPKRNVALVVGATGVVGRNLLQHLLSLDGWDVIAVSRRVPDVKGDYRHISVDLMDPVVDSKAMFPRLFAELQTNKIIP